MSIFAGTVIDPGGVVHIWYLATIGSFEEDVLVCSTDKGECRFIPVEWRYVDAKVTCPGCRGEAPKFFKDTAIRALERECEDRLKSIMTAVHERDWYKRALERIVASKGGAWRELAREALRKNAALAAVGPVVSEEESQAVWDSLKADDE